MQPDAVRFSDAAQSTASSTVSHIDSKKAISDPQLLRATRVYHVLSGFGAILQSSDGSAKSWSTSEQVKTIDEFVSHTWTTPRWSKFFVLALKYNYGVTLCLATLITIAVFALCAVKVMPLIEAPNAPVPLRCWTGRILLFPAMLLSLCAGHMMRRIFGLRGPNVFLDKTCIHQTDRNLKQLGIASLGAFLAKSKGMTIVFSDNYLERLWTVYELASMLALNPIAPITIIPVFLPKFVMAAAAISYLGNWMIEITIVAVGSSRLLMVLLICQTAFMACALLVGIEVTSRTRARVLNDVETFDIRHAKCCMESDREYVHDNIHRFLCELGYIVKDASTDTTLDAFNSIVREVVPAAVKSTLGRSGFAYRYLVLVGLGALGHHVDYIAASLYTRNFSLALLHFAAYATIDFCTQPLAFGFAVMISNWAAHITNPWSRALKRTIVTVSACFVCSFPGVVMAQNQINRGATPMVVGVQFVILVVYILITILVFRPLPRSEASVRWALQSSHERLYNERCIDTSCADGKVIEECTL